MRHLLAIAALPFVVAVAIPLWLVRRDNVALAFGATALEVVVQIGGLCLLLIGIALFVSSVRRFAGDGQGTLAPWDPPRRLVASGPYRYVRNPMISGVIFSAAQTRSPSFSRSSSSTTIIIFPSRISRAASSIEAKGIFLISTAQVNALMLVMTDFNE